MTMKYTIDDKKMIFQMRALDYLFLTNDRLDKLYNKAKELDLLEWLKEVAPNYYEV